MTEEIDLEPTPEQALENLCNMAFHASPADCGMDQGHLESATDVLKKAIRTLELRTAALYMAAQKFKEYQILYLTKSPPDEYKAALNAELAANCEKALAYQGTWNEDI